MKLAILQCVINFQILKSLPIQSTLKQSLGRLRRAVVWTRARHGYVVRALICWIFALFFLKFDENGNYDLRFRLRGDQKVTSKIALVTLRTSDFTKISDNRTVSLINTNERTDLNDSYYWDRSVWQMLIEQLLNEGAKSIGVTLYFGDNIGEVHLTTEELVTFKDPRVFWATNSSEPEKLSLPLTSRHDRSNLGHIDHLKDDDGITRRLLSTGESIPLLAERLLGTSRQGKSPPQRPGLSVINYKGVVRFSDLSLTDVFSHHYPKGFFKDKIVLIGSEKSINSQLQTPLGLMSRHEFLAQVTENFLSHGFIKQPPAWIYAIILLVLTILLVLIISHYPQTMAFLFFIWIATMVTAFSAWIFDTYAIWVPIVSPLSLLVFVWVLLIGYQALKIEQAHAKLKQQQSYWSELEQLKNNFVSLISHDLKTPIAKIQAVLDRLMATNHHHSPELSTDLMNLREYADELNRYIQSILKVLRVESREFKILKETADINGIIENVVERLRPLAESKSLKVQLELEPMFLTELDVTLMTEVFLNIIENAIKYTCAGGLIHVRSYELKDSIFVEIVDSGEGIHPNDHDHVWKKFGRGQSQSNKTKGSGLGLYLVKYFIELHGGQISFKSELKLGTTFTVQLPLDLNAISIDQSTESLT